MTFMSALSPGAILSLDRGVVAQPHEVLTLPMIRVSCPMFLTWYVWITFPVLGTYPKSHMVSEKDILARDSSPFWAKADEVRSTTEMNMM